MIIWVPSKGAKHCGSELFDIFFVSHKSVSREKSGWMRVGKCPNPVRCSKRQYGPHVEVEPPRQAELVVEEVGQC